MVTVATVSPGSNHSPPTSTLAADSLVMANSMPASVEPQPNAPWESPPRASDLPSSLSDFVTCTPPRATSSLQGPPVRSMTSPFSLIFAVFDQSEARYPSGACDSTTL